MANLLDLLHEQIVLGDGATGTYLYELGVPATHCLEELNLTRPELVTRVYQEYADAGARVIETNSFGANRVRLARYGLENQAAEINLRAAKVACQALQGRDVFVGGSVGPLSLRPADGEYSVDDRKAFFREQIGALLEGGCGLIFLETFSALDELLLALEVFRSLAKVPVVTSLGVSEEGRLSTGESFSEAVKILQQAGADVVGVHSPALATGHRPGRSHFGFSQRGQAGVLRGPLQLCGQRRLFRGHAAAVGRGRRTADRRRLRHPSRACRRHGRGGAGTSAGA
jgi:methionine synthase I (cobalamin-dependent)